jgi:hypothetical protein
MHLRERVRKHVPALSGHADQHIRVPERSKSQATVPKDPAFLFTRSRNQREALGITIPMGPVRIPVCTGMSGVCP